VEAIAAWTTPSQIKIWRLEDGTLILTVIDESPPAPPSDVLVKCICELEGQQLATGNSIGEIKIWYIAGLPPPLSTKLLKEANQIPVISLARLPSTGSSREGLIACSDDGTLILWDVSSGLCLREFCHEIIQKSPDLPIMMTRLRDHSLCTHQNGNTNIWNVREGKCIESFSFEGRRDTAIESKGEEERDGEASECCYRFSPVPVPTCSDGTCMIELKDGTLVMGCRSGAIRSVRRPIE